MTIIEKQETKKTVMIEYMKVILASPERMNDYADEDDIFKSIADDASEMANAMIKKMSK